MRKLFFLSLTLLVAVWSCTQKAESTEVDTSVTYDSTALHVALMPCINALPVYYAVETGMDKEVGLNMQLLHYTAQMDIDTAAIRGHADVFLTDTIRLEYLAKECSCQPILSGIEPLSLIAHVNTRCTKVKQLKEKMLSSCRKCATSAWAEFVCDSAGLGEYDIFRPQVNDVMVRYQMLNSELLDAAVLPEPFATMSVNQGHRRLAVTSEPKYATAVWVSGVTEPEKDEQIAQFCSLYNEAVTRMNAGEQPEVVRHILTDQYALDAAGVDTLTLARLKHAHLLAK